MFESGDYRLLGFEIEVLLIANCANQINDMHAKSEHAHAIHNS